MAKPHPLLLELAADRLPLAPPASDDPMLVESAIEHRMQGLLWQAIQRDDLELLREKRLRLSQSYLRSRKHNQRLWEAATEISHVLDAEGIQVAVFKGIAAERQLYGQVGLRPCFDLDLWLAPASLSRSEEAVRRLHPGHPLSGQVGSLVARRSLRSLDLHWRGVRVDLHFDPVKIGVWFGGDEALWDTCEETDGGLRMVGLELGMLIALLHLNKDRFSRLLGFADVVRASETPGIAQEAWLLARRLGIETPVAASARVVARALRTDVEMPPPHGWRRRVWQMLWPERGWLRGEEGYQHGRAREDLIPFFCRDGLVNGVRFLRHVWFPPHAMLTYFNPHTKGMTYPIALLRARIGH
jgi:hypothetical protein